METKFTVDDTQLGTITEEKLFQSIKPSCRPIQVQLSLERPRLAGVHPQLLPGREDAPAQEQAGDSRHEQEAAQHQGSNLQHGQVHPRGRALNLRRLAIWPILIHSVVQVELMKYISNACTGVKIDNTALSSHYFHLT